MKVKHKLGVALLVSILLLIFSVLLINNQNILEENKDVIRTEDNHSENIALDLSGESVAESNRIEKVIIEKIDKESEYIFFENKIYYLGRNEDNEKAIYMYDVFDKSNKLILDMPLEKDNSYGIVLSPEFYIDNNKLNFKFHIGGATMGSDKYYRIDKDGDVKLIFSGYADILEYDNNSNIILMNGPFIDSNNISIMDGDKSQAINSNGAYYNSMQLIDKSLYVTKKSTPSESSAENRLYKINLDDFSESLVCDMKIDSFELADRWIYYKEAGTEKLYRKRMEANYIKNITENAAADFTLLKNKIFYIEKSSKQIYMCDASGNTRKVLNGFSASKLKSYGEFVVCMSERAGAFDVIILDIDGEIVYKTEQLVKTASVYNNQMLYTDLEDDLYIVNINFLDELVNFDDKAFEDYIRKALKKEEGDITREDMESIKALLLINYAYVLGEKRYLNSEDKDGKIKSTKLDSDKIESIEGIQYCTNLDFLWISSKNLKDISPIKNLKKLKTLSLISDSVDDIASLSNLEKLWNFDIYSESLVDIDVIKNFKNLKSLTISGKLIDDISPISDLKKLESLNIYETGVKELSAIKDLDKLKELNVETKYIFDIRFFFDIYYLKHKYNEYFG